MIRFLAVVAGGASAFLTRAALGQDPLPGCGPESGCGEVLSSRWGYWFGIPVSVAGLVTYAAVFAATFGVKRAPGAFNTASWWVLTCAAVLLPLLGVWFIGVQWLLIESFCPFCLTAHACGLVMAAVLAAQFRRRTLPRPAPRILGSSVAAGALAAAALVVGQCVDHRPTFVVRTLPSDAVLQTRERAIHQQTPLPGQSNVLNESLHARPSHHGQAGRHLELHGGAFRFALDSVPVIGEAGASEVGISLFDYTCSYCRTTHRTLAELLSTSSNQLAFVSLPVPLERSCNPIVRRVLPEHTNACVYARLGLAVWRAAPHQLGAFDAWMFSTPRPPPVSEARARAAALVGTNALETALADPWVEQVLAEGIRLYHTNYLVYRTGRMPQVMLGTNLASGSIGEVQQLSRLLMDPNQSQPQRNAN